jgi:hypothetical protein
LKTKENEEVYLYRTTGENKSFEENYKEMLEKQAQYTGDKKWNRIDILNIPFIKITEIEETNQPEDSYVMPPSNEYVPTSGIF